MQTRRNTLSRDGLKLFRNAVSESVNPITEPLIDAYGNRKSLDWRSWDNGNPLHIPHISYFSARQVTRQQWPKGIPLGPIVEAITTGVPELGSPTTLRLDRVHSEKRHSGEYFLALKLDEPSRKQIIAERREVIEAIHHTVREQRKWPVPKPDMTIVYGSAETSQRSWDEVVAHVSSLLPLEIEFERAVILPHLPMEETTDISSPTA
jgi:hypothetical protein